jgi:hypothetical protein
VTRTADRDSECTWSGPVAGPAVTTLGAFDLERQGYVSEEWLLEGTACSRRASGEMGDDGRWITAEDSTAPYRSRLIVCRPADPAGFKGTVVVEWLNVSGGGDGSPDWFFLHRHLMREGAAWVGVSAQKAGIDGGGFFDSGQHLKAVAPERYGILSHPGDAFSFDIFSHAGFAIRSRTGPLADFEIETILAVGESQSAVFLVTYINAFDQLARMYDGFLVHGRGSSGATIDGQMFVGTERLHFTGSQRVRDDVRVPVMTVQSETDLVMMAGIRGRQPDHERFRWWEIAGAAHFDSYGLIASQRDDGTLSPSELAALMTPLDEIMGMKTAGLINSGPQQHYVLNAAVARLKEWVRQGIQPPSAAWLQSETGPEPSLIRDDLGLALGGIRTPWVDAPVAVLSGQGHEGEMFTALFGSTRPFDAEALVRLYPGGRDEYLAIFESRLEETIAAGFILAADREEIAALAAAACPLV